MLTRALPPISFAVSLLLSTGAWAQSAAEADSIRVVIAERVCEDFRQVDASALSSAELQSKMGIALIQELRAIPNAAEILEIDFTSPEGMRVAGEQIGIRMGTMCPELFERFITEELAEEEARGARSETVVAQRAAAIGDAFPTEVRVRTEDGSTLVLLWLSAFEGEELALDDSMPELEYAYETVEWYDARKRAYVPRRVITGVRRVE